MNQELMALYRERVRLNIIKTTRELNRFFINIHPAKIVIAAAIFMLG